MNNQIVVIGSCMIDFVSYAPRLPKKGETVHGTKFVTNFGGKGANQCVAAAKLGGTVNLIARLGDDLWADNYLKDLQLHNVDTKFVQKTPNTSTGIAQINVAANGENQIIIVAGANNYLNTEDITINEDLIRNAKVLVCQLETKTEVAIRAMEICEKGIKILNAAPAISDYDLKLLTLPTIFCVNESEASIFSGLPVHNKTEALVAGRRLISKGCNNVIITLGDQGAMYVNSDNNPYFINCPKVNCVDSTGAGDAFIGALSYLLATKSSSEPIEKLIEIACFIASESVTKLGTQISFPSKEIFTLEQFSKIEIG